MSLRSRIIIINTLLQEIKIHISRIIYIIYILILTFRGNTCFYTYIHTRSKIYHKTIYADRNESSVTIFLSIPPSPPRLIFTRTVE